MTLVVGLGNPGREFIGTRHNVGFAVLDRLAHELGVSFLKNAKLQSLVARSDDEDIILAKPLTFMNLSGSAVAKISRFYRIAPEDVWLIYDDVDLPVGTARVKGKGTGESRHKGVLSVVGALKTVNFPRFRIGVAQAVAAGRVVERPHRPTDLKRFVLSTFDKREQPLVTKTIDWVVAEIRQSLEKNTVIARTLTKGV